MKDLKEFPTSPGVYIHKDKSGEIIYIGKAKNLRKRIASYFNNSNLETKNQFLIQNINSTEYIITNNELEALLLENQLIKKHKPKYNIELKEAAKYFYIRITREDFPQVLVTRKINKKDLFFGPYTGSIKGFVKMLRDFFKFRTCSIAIRHSESTCHSEPTCRPCESVDPFRSSSISVTQKKSCIYKDMNLCLAPCVKNVSKEKYKKVIDEVIRFIKIGNDNLMDEYFLQMNVASKKLDFEKALEFRKKIDLLKRLKQKQIVDVVSNNDFDAIGMARSDGKSCICVLRVKNGVLLNKKMFKFVTSDDLLNQFLKLYYSESHAPSEIIVDDDFDPSIEEYLSSLSLSCHPRVGGDLVLGSDGSVMDKAYDGIIDSKDSLSCHPRVGGDPVFIRHIKIKYAKSGQKADIVALAKKNAYFGFKFEDQALIEIKEMLKLEHLPKVIDCFDVSNMGEDLIVGACVQFKDKIPNTSSWQVFNIKGDFGQDDFRSIYEIVKRRYEKYSLPDLILIDGGRIQVNFAIKALLELSLKTPFALPVRHSFSDDGSEATCGEVERVRTDVKCPVVGLAKKEETIIFQDGSSLRLNRRKDGSKLLIEIRNATHNFVIKHCRKSFNNLYKKSELDNVKGIGPVTKFKLLQHFKSLDAIKRASSEELALIIGDKLSKIIKRHFVD